MRVEEPTDASSYTDPLWSLSRSVHTGRQVSSGPQSVADQIDASIVIPTYARSESLRRCIESIKRSNRAPFLFEVIVVDDCPSDQSTRMIALEYPGTTFMRHKAIEFPGKSLWDGYQAASGRYLIRVDDDNELYPETLVQLVRFMDSHPGVAFCGATAVREDRTTVANRGVVISSITGAFSPPKEILEGVPQFSEPYKVDLVDNVYICRMELLKRVGGFSAYRYFPWSLEDAIPQLLLAKRGYGVVCLPYARTVHYSHSRLFNADQVYHLVRSRVLFAIYWKRRPIPVVALTSIPHIVFRVIHSAEESGRAVLRSALLAALRGYLDGLRLALTIVGRSQDPSSCPGELSDSTGGPT